MALRADTTSLVPGKLVASRYAGLGVLGANVSGDGTSGASLRYKDGLDPAKEYRYVPSYIPPGLTATFHEDLSVEASAADGVYVVEGAAYEDGAAYGAPTATFTFGAEIPEDAPTPTVFRGHPNNRIALDLGALAILADGSMAVVLP